jgi:hypothetical protein
MNGEKWKNVAKGQQKSETARMTEIDAFVHTPALAQPDMNNFEGSDDAAAVSTSADEAAARKAAAFVSDGIELLLLALTAKGELRDDDCTSASFRRSCSLAPLR